MAILIKERTGILHVREHWRGGNQWRWEPLRRAKKNSGSTLPDTPFRDGQSPYDIASLLNVEIPEKVCYCGDESHF